jgi:anti-anti-sigma regulatory factor
VKPSPRIELARSQGTVYIRVVGLGDIKICPTLYDLANRMARDGYKKFIFDLKDCTGMDSTFMGTLVEIGTLSPPPQDALMVINPSKRSQNLLESVGLTEVIKVRTGRMRIPPVEVEVIRDTGAPHDRRIALVRRAHENLIRIDKRNEAKFGQFLKTLTRELRG